MEKIFIKNRNNKKIAVALDRAEDSRGLAFILHGFGGFKEQPHIEIMAQAFLGNGYDVVRFDVVHTIGESEGNMEEATLTNYYEDLEDVIKWSKGEDWYQEPFCLAGHSLGSACIMLYALRNPKEVKALAPISSVVSGQITLNVFDTEEIKEWNRTGWALQESRSKPGVIKKLNWHNFTKDLLQYDLLPELNKISVPVLLISGDNDECLESQKLLYSKLACQKELHIIKDAPHSIRDKKQLQQMKNIFENWIKKL